MIDFFLRFFCTIPIGMMIERNHFLCSCRISILLWVVLINRCDNPNFPLCPASIKAYIQSYYVCHDVVPIWLRHSFAVMYGGKRFAITLYYLLFLYVYSVDTYICNIHCTGSPFSCIHENEKVSQCGVLYPSALVHILTINYLYYNNHFGKI